MLGYRVSMPTTTKDTAGLTMETVGGGSGHRRRILSSSITDVPSVISDLLIG